MKKPKIYITRLIPEPALAELKEYCDIEMNLSSRILSKDELVKKVRGKDAILVSHTTMDAETIAAAAPSCKILASYGVGYDNIDLASATQHGIYVSNNPDAVTDATADMTWSLILGTARRIVESDHFVRSEQKGWGPTLLLGSHVTGKTLGIIGAGRIGTAVAKRAKGFDMDIIYTDTQQNSSFETLTGGKFVSKHTLLQEADFVSVHIPRHPSTYHYIGIDELKLMKKTAILINAARGDIIHEKALVEALKNGLIAGAGLDVFENEPQLEPGLTSLANVVLTPHVGTSTLDTRIKQGAGCARNIRAALAGKIPPNCLNPEVRSQSR